MGKTEKKVNKILIGAIIGSALIGVGGMSMTPKGQSFWKRLRRRARRGFRFFKRGYREMKKEIEKETSKK